MGARHWIFGFIEMVRASTSRQELVIAALILSFVLLFISFGIITSSRAQFLNALEPIFVTLLLMT